MGVSTTPKLPEALRDRVVNELGELDPLTEAAAMRVLSARNADEFYDAERELNGVVRKRADSVVAFVLQHRCGASEYVEPARSRAHEAAKEQGIQLVSNGRRTTRVQLLGGLVVTLETLRMHPVLPPKPGPKRKPGQRGAAGAGFYPVLAELGISDLSTPALMSEVAREVTEAHSVAVARASLLERGLDIPHKTALRLSYEFADKALAERDIKLAATLEAPPAAGEFSGKSVVVGVDGGRVRIRVNPKAGRRNAKTGHRRYKAPWREPKVMTIYAVDEHGERDESVKVVLDGTMGDADDVLALMVGHLRLRGAHLATHLTLVGDGAEWIWGRAEELRLAVGLPPERFTQVVDYFHAAEYLHKVAALRKNWSEVDREKWVKQAKKDLHAGRHDKVVGAIDALRSGRRSKSMTTCREYFVGNRDRMNYPKFRKMGLPSGSGAVESAIRRVVNLRMKGNSIYWLSEHAEAMLHLRAYLKAGRWDELVRSAIKAPVWTAPKAA